MKYLMADVTKTTGVSHHRMVKWMQLDYIKPSLGCASGSGTRNIFSRNDLYKIAVFKYMIENGWYRDEAGKIIRMLTDDVIQRLTLDWELKKEASRVNGEEITKAGLYIAFCRIANAHHKTVLVSCYPLINCCDDIPGNPQCICCEDLIDMFSFYHDVYIVNFASIAAQVDGRISEL